MGRQGCSGTSAPRLKEEAHSTGFCRTFHVVSRAKRRPLEPLPLLPPPGTAQGRRMRSPGSLSPAGKGLPNKSYPRLTLVSVSGQRGSENTAIGLAFICGIVSN